MPSAPLSLPIPHERACPTITALVSSGGVSSSARQDVISQRKDSGAVRVDDNDATSSVS